MNIEMIRAARQRLEGRVRKTPLLNSPAIDEMAGRRVFIKPECLQHTGSFKYRGAVSAITALSDDQLKRGVIAYSSGNHAQGIALAARQAGSSAVIVMPSDAPRMKIENTRAYGGETVLYDRPNGDDRDAIGREIAEARGLTLVKPFDEPEVIAGQGTCGLEIAAQVRAEGVDEADVIVCCGGGGFASGIALALEAEAPQMRVRPAEPAQFDDMARSLIAGERLSNAAPSGSICDAIISPTPGEITFPILQRLAGPGLVVTDDEAMQAMVAAFNHLKLVAEPGGAVALASAMFRKDEIKGDAVIVTISGGNVDAAMFARALTTFGGDA